MAAQIAKLRAKKAAVEEMLEEDVEEGEDLEVKVLISRKEYQMLINHKRAH